MRDDSTTPLIALDAVVIDTETTGLDPARARIVEFGAVRINMGRLDDRSVFRSLVDPGEPIPPSSTAIHRITDADVAGAPSFAALWPKLAALFADTVVIGHTVGFDLAVLRRECERAGLAWRAPRTLDTRLLSEVVQPHLGGHSLEHLCGWLGLPVEGRHSAVSDALMTARIFLALVPKLREGNIRTLAEAEQSCFEQISLLEDQHRAGWEDAVRPPSQRETPAYLRIDAYPYRHRVRDVMRAPPKFVLALTPLGEVLTQMTQDKISSLLVTAAGAGPMRPAETGIVTERDVLRALAEKGPLALARPVSEFASKPLATLPEAAFLYRALGRMSRLGLRHLGVENENGEVSGIITSRDLLRLRAQEVTILGDAIDDAGDVPALGAAWARLSLAARGLVAEDVPGIDVAAVISRELGEVTRRAGILAEQQMAAGGLGPPPCAYALCVLGSGGRGESLLAMDQDNALVFAEGEPDGAEDRWFAQFGTIVADILDEVGVPYCTGGVMAKNPPWRGSLATWKRRIADWVTRSTPADLLSVDIFFDLAAVHGDARLAVEIWRDGFECARGNAAFAKLLAEAAGGVAESITMFGGIRTDQGRIDLKKAGLFGIVTAARVLAIRHHILERSTPARLTAIAALGRSEANLTELMRAQAVFLDLILRQQIADIDNGLPPSNKVSVKDLSSHDKSRLKEALSSVRHLDQLTQDLLF